MRIAHISHYVECRWIDDARALVYLGKAPMIYRRFGVYIVQMMLNELHLRQLSEHPRPVLVLCLCAEWCDTCVAYRPGFEALAARYADCDFVWADIEDDAHWVGRFDVENFPTLLIQHGDQVLSYGVLQPHVSHLEKLIKSLLRMPEGERAAWIASPERAAWQSEFNWRAQLRDLLPT